MFKIIFKKKSNARNCEYIYALNCCVCFEFYLPRNFINWLDFAIFVHY
jgi:hypothetical protein